MLHFSWTVVLCRRKTASWRPLFPSPLPRAISVTSPNYGACLHAAKGVTKGDSLHLVLGGDVGECVWARAPARMLASSAFSQVVHSAREAQRNEMHSLEDWAAPVISFPSLRCVLWAHLVLFARGLAPLGCLPAPLLPLVCLVKGLRHVGEGGEGQRWKGFVPSGAVTL